MHLLQENTKVSRRNNKSNESVTRLLSIHNIVHLHLKFIEYVVINIKSFINCCLKLMVKWPYGFSNNYFILYKDCSIFCWNYRLSAIKKFKQNITWPYFAIGISGQQHNLSYVCARFLPKMIWKPCVNMNKWFL